MTFFKGFRTKEAAEKFRKKNGGVLTWEKYTPKLHKPTQICKDYMCAVQYGGLDRKKYPYCVQWNE